MPNDELILDVVLASEFKAACKRNGWRSASQIKALTAGSVMRGILEVLEGRAEIVPRGRKKKLLKFDPRYMKHGAEMELIEHATRTVISVAEIEAVSFLRDGERRILGYDVIGRARFDPRLVGTNLGQEDAEFCLEHQDEIPVELRQCILVFPGTIRRHPGGYFYVPYLDWDGERWVLAFGWLGGGWHSSGRLVRPSQVAVPVTLGA